MKKEKSVKGKKRDKVEFSFPLVLCPYQGTQKVNGFQDQFLMANATDPQIF